MTNKVIRYGILGCGMMGQEHIRNILLLDNVEITVLAEPNAEMREKAQALVPNARTLEGLDALLEADDIDALVIATPNFQHAEQLQAL